MKGYFLIMVVIEKPGRFLKPVRFKGVADIEVSIKQKTPLPQGFCPLSTMERGRGEVFTFFPIPPSFASFRHGQPTPSLPYP
jgi:hypothetical protein